MLLFFAILEELEDLLDLALADEGVASSSRAELKDHLMKFRFLG